MSELAKLVSEIIETQSATCVKTGCEVWLDEYRCWTRGDAFKIGPVYVFRLVSSMINEHCREKPDYKHFQINKIGLIFDKDQNRICTVICHESAIEDFGSRGIAVD